MFVGIAEISEFDDKVWSKSVIRLMKTTGAKA